MPEAPAAPATPATTPAAAAAPQTVLTPPAAAPATPPAAPAPAAAAPAAAVPAAKPGEAAPPAKDPAAPSKTILGGEPPKDAPKEGAPEKYADFTLPEGVTPNATVMDSFKGIAKELGLSQVAAQKLVDFQAQSVKAEVDARLNEFTKTVEAWGEESKKAFGSDFAKEFGNAAKAVERFGDASLRTMLQETGLGNHPALVKFCAKVGALLKEDAPVDGRRAGGEGKSTAELMFDKMPAKKT